MKQKVGKRKRNTSKQQNTSPPFNTDGNENRNTTPDSKKPKNTDESPQSTLATSDIIAQANRSLYLDYAMSVQPTPSMSTQSNLMFSPDQGMPMQQQIPYAPPGQLVSPPPWVCEILKKLQSIDNHLSGMDEKLKKLDILEVRLKSLEGEVSKAVKEVKSVSEISRELNDRTDGLEFSVGEMEGGLAGLREQNRKLQEQVTDLKARSMRDNLVFLNVTEKPTDNVEDTLRSFLREEMKITSEEEETIKFERVHRYGARGSRPRKSVAKFSEYKQKESVKSASKNLKGSNYFVMDQYPPEIIEQRRKLVPIMKQARQDGKTANLVVNRLSTVNHTPQDRSMRRLVTSTFVIP
jgi:hypothetical protein